jgi:hypothetical protein
MFNAWWSSGQGYQCVAQLHNNLVNGPLTVQPVLFTADGQKITLSSVSMEALGNATVDIGAALTLNGWTSPFSGSAVFQYQLKNPGALTVEVYG